LIRCLYLYFWPRRDVNCFSAYSVYFYWAFSFRQRRWCRGYSCWRCGIRFDQALSEMSVFNPSRFLAGSRVSEVVSYATAVLCDVHDAGVPVVLCVELEVSEPPSLVSSSRLRRKIHVLVRKGRTVQLLKMSTNSARSGSPTRSVTWCRKASEGPCEASGVRR